MAHNLILNAVFQAMAIFTTLSFAVLLDLAMLLGFIMLLSFAMPLLSWLGLGLGEKSRVQRHGRLGG